jgi:uncharacterized protein
MPERRVRLTIGDIELDSSWNDSPTADALYAALPMEAEGAYWGGEIYFKTPVRVREDPMAGNVVEPGTVAYWAAGSCLCIFWGPTPASLGGECRAAYPVNIVGEIVNKTDLHKLKARRIRMEAAAG